MTKQIIVMDGEDAAKADHKCYLLGVISELKDIKYTVERAKAQSIGKCRAAHDRCDIAIKQITALSNKIENDSK